jgi:prepilin-type N-terminal cleavage/methylation domain-containing protein
MASFLLKFKIERERTMMRTNSGITLPELIIALSIISILALLVAPQIGLIRSKYNVRSCATELIQNMRVARAMAIKENREYLIVFDTANQRYLIGFDGDGDNNLITVNSDTFGVCKDADNDRIPDTDSDANGDGVPDCVRVVNLSDCGYGIQFGTIAPNGPNNTALCANGLGVCFGNTANPVRADFNPDGTVGNLGSAYLQQTTRGYSYCVRISNNAGATSMWKWDGDRDKNPGVTTWTEIR